MTNFDNEKKRIWDSVKSDDKKEFDKSCEALMEKAVGDWWRIGWDICPKDVNEIISLFEDLSTKSHEMWLEAIERGDAPNEDVSPGEGFAKIAEILKNFKNEL